jgi:hypothetical protein
MFYIVHKSLRRDWVFPTRKCIIWAATTWMERYLVLFSKAHIWYKLMHNFHGDWYSTITGMVDFTQWWSLPLPHPEHPNFTKRLCKTVYTSVYGWTDNHSLCETEVFTVVKILVVWSGLWQCVVIWEDTNVLENFAVPIFRVKMEAAT